MTAMTHRILFAEDNPHDAEMTLDALAELGLAADVCHVSDGAAALDYLHTRGRYAGRTPGQPLLVLLDVKMPKIDGLGVLRAIKQNEALSGIPVVMLTSSREEQDVVQSYELGVNAYVVKPVDSRAFVEAVKQVGAFWTLLNQPPPGSTAPRPSTPR
jgi:CheY-like chemotaxis protein